MFICSFLIISLPVWASAVCSLKGIGKYCILMYFVKEFTTEITGDTIWTWSFLRGSFFNYKSISFVYIWCCIVFLFSFFLASLLKICVFQGIYPFYLSQGLAHYSPLAKSGPVPMSLDALTLPWLRGIISVEML